MNRRIVVAGLVLSLAACGGGDDASSDTAVVESSDGMASLTLSPASLPEGVSVDDIRVELAVGSSEEPGAPFAAVRLSPSGLSLSESAMLRVEVPPDTEQLLVVHSSSDGFEFVAADFEPTDDGLVASVEVDHFSVITLSGMNILVVTGAAEPSNLTEGETQLVHLEVDIPEPLLSIWMFVGDEKAPEFQRFDFRVETISPYGTPVVRWWGSGGLSPDWSPNEVDAAVEIDGRFLAMEASSLCIEANSANPFAILSLELELRLEGKGEKIAAHMLDLAGLFEDQVRAVPKLQTDEQGTVVPFTLRVGESVQAVESVFDGWVSECVAASVDDTTSTSTSTTTTIIGPEEPPDLDEIASDPQFFDCPIDYQLDIIGRLLSGQEGEQSEHIADTPEAKAANLACTKYEKKNPHVFTFIVEGDGENLPTADHTFYEVTFIVNNMWPENEYYDDTGFIVHVGYNRRVEQWGGQVNDQQGNRLSNDADVIIEWLDSSTLQVTVDLPDLDVEVTEVRTELFVYATDANDVSQYRHRDVAIWLLQP